MNMDKALILKRLREYLNLATDTAFANFLGINPSTISTWKRRNTIDYELIVAKCKGVNANWLITGEGNMLSSEVYNNVSQHSNTAVNGNGEQVSIKGAVQGNTVALSAEVERLKEALKVCGAEKEALHERLKEAQEAVKNAMEAVKVLATSNRQ